MHPALRRPSALLALTATAFAILPSEASAQITGITDSRVQVYFKSQAPVPVGSCPTGYGLAVGAGGMGPASMQAMPPGGTAFSAPGWTPASMPTGGSPLPGIPGIDWISFDSSPVIFSVADSGISGTNQTIAYVGIQAKYWIDPADDKANTTYNEYFGLPYVKQDPGATGASFLVMNWSVDYSIGPGGLTPRFRSPGATLTGTILPTAGGTSFAYGKWHQEYWRIATGVAPLNLGQVNLPAGAATHCFDALGPFSATYGDSKYIPAAAQTGAFTLRVIGRLELEVDPATIAVTPSGEGPAPVTYCTAKLNSMGCMPSISSLGAMSASAGIGFTVTGSNVLNRKPGLMIYSNAGRLSMPFQGGYLCVRSPIKRTSSVSSGGSPLPILDCSGVFSLDLNAFAHSAGSPAPAPYLLIPGTVVDCQWWGRDPGLMAPNNSSLTNALEFTVGA